MRLKCFDHPHARARIITAEHGAFHALIEVCTSGVIGLLIERDVADFCGECCGVLDIKMDILGHGGVVGSDVPYVVEFWACDRLILTVAHLYILRLNSTLTSANTH